MKIRALSALLVCVLLSARTRADDWTQFRGPRGQGVSAEKDLPVSWGPRENVHWKAPLPGRGLSNPVIAAGRVYVTACSSYKEKRLHVLCFEEATGKKLWERQLAATGGTACHPKTNMAAPTPVTDGQHVYALFATGDLAAFDRDGALLWYRSLVSDYPTITNQVGMAASAVLAGDTLVVPMDNAGESFLAGLDVRTGENRWKVSRTREINWVTPLVADVAGQSLAIFQNGEAVNAYSAKTGEEVWTYPTRAATISSPTAGAGMLFVPGSPFVALKPQGQGRTPEMVWQSRRLSLGYTSPVYYQERIYGLVRNVGVSCLDAKTGELVWQQRLRGDFAASPVIADGKLYAINETGATSVIALGEKPQLLATNTLEGTFLATPAIANGAIYLRSDGWLYCIKK